MKTQNQSWYYAMYKSTEQFKFEASGRALELEMKQNPQACSGCTTWQLGGDMSLSLHHCSQCGKKKAKSVINSQIVNYANFMGITYDEAWDIANAFLIEKGKEYSAKGLLYFDEDHFELDLEKHIAKLRSVAKHQSFGLNYGKLGSPLQETPLKLVGPPAFIRLLKWLRLK